jgi:hypothetical protein
VRIQSGRLSRAVVSCSAVIAVTAIAGGAFAINAAAATKPSPPANAHAIFDNNAKAPFRVGQIIDILPSARKPSPGKITKVCFSPAPIARPACSKFGEAAPSAVGVTKITVSFSKRAPYVLKVKVLAAATKVGGEGGGLAVPATVTCPSVSLYDSAQGAKTKNEKPAAILPQGTQVALYNTIAPGTITMIDYATGTSGFGEEACAKPGI